ncbi:MAG: hypothetical protein CMK09_10005 [Ponticaulis sp.]|nr:hypothetical protein [Ponticaulis sp.]
MSSDEKLRRYKIKKSGETGLFGPRKSPVSRSQKKAAIAKIAAKEVVAVSGLIEVQPAATPVIDW